MTADHRSGFGRAGSVLVIVEDDRVALATALVLQEMNHAVDIVMTGFHALEWLRRARYDIVVCGPGGEDVIRLAGRIRRELHHGRVVLLSIDDERHAELERLGVEIVHPPLDVNQLVRRFWPAAA